MLGSQSIILQSAIALGIALSMVDSRSNMNLYEVFIFGVK